jgi:23S rRNA (cytidine1920-2'-O)/16S rRNA (cytidine1409-2'-O)-methyltransferase
VPRRRLDAELVRRGLVSDRSEAEAAVAAGLVTIGGQPATTTATMVGTDAPVRVTSLERGHVSRGGEKLRAALERFRVDVTGRDCLDAGASTGGFTDRLLRAGAARVIAVDVGYGQLAWALRNDPRVTVMERTNVRELRIETLPFIPDLVVADLSFVSLKTALPALADLAGKRRELIVLVKPQFEASPDFVGDRGVVRDPEVWRAVLADVVAAAGRVGLGASGVMASPLVGRSGNVEFLVHLREGAMDAIDLDAPVAEGEALVR